MRHYSCDLCGKTLAAGDDSRYLVRVEGHAVVDEDTTLDDSDADSVDAMEEFLTEQVAFEAIGEDADSAEIPLGSAKKEYDLCRGCYARLLNDPLGLETRHAPRFSRN